MGLYPVTPQDYRPHNFNSSKLSFTCNEVTTIIEGLHRLEAAKISNDIEDPFEVASGQGIHVELNGQAIMLKLQLLEASPSTDALVTALQTGKPVAFSFTDDNAPELNCSSRSGRFQKHPDIIREGAPQTPEWIIIAAYGRMQGGSYTLQAVT